MDIINADDHRPSFGEAEQYLAERAQNVHIQRAVYVTLGVTRRSGEGPDVEQAHGVLIAPRSTRSTSFMSCLVHACGTAINRVAARLT